MADDKPEPASPPQPQPTSVPRRPPLDRWLPETDSKEISRKPPVADSGGKKH